MRGKEDWLAISTIPAASSSEGHGLYQRRQRINRTLARSWIFALISVLVHPPTRRHGSGLVETWLARTALRRRVPCCAGRVCSSAVEHPNPGAVMGSSPIRSTMRIAQLVEHETVNLAVLGSIPKSHSHTRDFYTGSRLLPPPNATGLRARSAANDGEAPRPSRIPLRCKARAQAPERSRCCNLVSKAAR